MYQMNTKPQDLTRAAKDAKAAKRKAEVDAVLKGVDEALAKFLKEAKARPGASSQVVYTNHQVSDDVLREACGLLVSHGFVAVIDRYAGCYDGPGSVHSSPPETRIIITAE